MCIWCFVLTQTALWLTERNFTVSSGGTRTRGMLSQELLRLRLRHKLKAAGSAQVKDNWRIPRDPFLLQMEGEWIDSTIIPIMIPHNSHTTTFLRLRVGGFAATRRLSKYWTKCGGSRGNGGRRRRTKMYDGIGSQAEGEEDETTFFFFCCCSFFTTLPSVGLWVGLTHRRASTLPSSALGRASPAVERVVHKKYEHIKMSNKSYKIASLGAREKKSQSVSVMLPILS